jgi:hypothetical protein
LLRCSSKVFFQGAVFDCVGWDIVNAMRVRRWAVLEATLNEGQLARGRASQVMSGVMVTGNILLVYC